MILRLILNIILNLCSMIEFKILQLILPLRDTFLMHFLTSALFCHAKANIKNSVPAYNTCNFIILNILDL